MDRDLIMATLAFKEYDELIEIFEKLKKAVEAQKVFIYEYETTEGVKRLKIDSDEKVEIFLSCLKQAIKNVSSNIITEKTLADAIRSATKKV